MGLHARVVSGFCITRVTDRPPRIFKDAARFGQVFIKECLE
jgi:hypothetical protein